MPLTVAVSTDPVEPNRGLEFEAHLQYVKRRFQHCVDAESEIRSEGKIDLDFRAGKQWPAELESDRSLAGRPCLTINRIQQFLRQVVNEQRQNRPAIQVNPVGDGADQETAEIIQGLIRHIEGNSNADVAYDTAFDHACTMGFGYFRVLTKWVDERSFDQEIMIERVPDPFKVYFDPSAIQPDYSDAKYAFVFEDLTTEDFKSQYGKQAETTGLEDMTSTGDNISDWYPGGKIRVAEYFEIQEEEQEIAELADGAVMLLKAVPPNVEPVRTRTAIVPTVHWEKLTARQVLKQGDVPGTFIPIIPVLGDEIILEGKRQLVGMVRFARDAQRQYNYMRSALVEAIALAPKAPFVIAEGQMEGHEDEWKYANTRNLSALAYKPTEVNGTPLPPPQRQTAEPAVQAVAVAIQQADHDLMSTMGLYQDSLGAQRTADESGKAVLARQNAGQVANFNFTDNLSRALKHCGRVILGMIPAVYNRKRVIHIIQPDGTRAATPINDFNQAVDKVFNLTVGRYDIDVSTGPSYRTKRQEAVASILELVKDFPPLMQVAGDLLVSNMDWDQHKEIAQRLKYLLPPAIQQAEAAQQMKDLPPAVIQQFQALQAQLQKLEQMLQPKMLEMQSRERIAAADRASAERIAELKIQGGIVDAALAGKNQIAQQMASQLTELEFGSVKHRLDLDDAAQQRQHEQDLQQQEIQAESQQQQADQQQQQQMQQQQQASQPAQPGAQPTGGQ